MPYQRWRLEFDKTNGGGVIAGSEIEFFSTVGGTDETASGGTASQSSTYAPFDAINAFDNNSGTLFAFNDTKGWIEWDFGSGNEKDLVGFSFKARTDGAENQSFKVGRMQFYNGSSWITLFNVTGSAYSLGEKKFFYCPDPGAQLFWRVQGLCQRFAGGDRLGCSELEFATTVGGSTECSGGTPVSDSDYGGNVKAYAFDGTTNEWWSDVIGKGYIGYGFATAKNIVEMSWTSATGLPSAFSIDEGGVESGPDGICWLPMWPISRGGTAWGDRERVSFESTYIPPVAGGRRRRSFVA